MLAIIPARAGSKGVPGKNKAPIAGRPLVDYTVAALVRARSVTGIILSTDDEELLALYRDRPGIFVLKRPKRLAADDSTTADVVAHALDAWRADGRDIPDALFVAQPITPLRTAADIDAAFELFKRTGCESLISACRQRASAIRAGCIAWGRASSARAPFLAEPEPTRRQDFETVYQRNGAVYLVTTEFFLRTGRLRSDNPVIYEMPWERSINIDVPGDLMIARALIESGMLGE